MNLYKLARQVNDLSKLMSGDPNKIARRVKNKAIGRALGRAGFWRGLWK